MSPSELIGKTLLIVDDEPFLRDLLVDQFKAMGANVLSAENGNEALALFEQNPIDLVLSDVMMSNGNGIEFLAKVRNEKKSGVPFFFMTAFANDFTAEDARLKGANEVFAKPFKLNVLKDSILRALGA
jgi:CheY-like chemotaxis protein